jgi:hypothetical protein
VWIGDGHTSATLPQHGRHNLKHGARLAVAATTELILDPDDQALWDGAIEDGEFWRLHARHELLCASDRWRDAWERAVESDRGDRRRCRQPPSKSSPTAYKNWAAIPAPSATA